MTRTEKLFLVLVGILGLFLHFRNLSGAIYLNEDEARFFSLLSSGQLLYLLGNPVYLFCGHSQTSVFYLTAAVGLADIGLAYLALRSFFGSRQSAIGALLYALMPFRVNYARTLFPSAYIDLFFLSALWFCVKGLREKRALPIVVSGALSACMIFSNYSSFGAYAGLAIAGLVRPNQAPYNRMTRKRFLTAFLSGSIALYAVLDLVLRKVEPGYSLIGKMHSFAVSTVMLTGQYFRTKFNPSRLTLIVPAIVLVLAVYGILRFLRKRSSESYFFVSVAAVGSLVFLGSWTCFYGFYPRHFTWLAVFIAAGAAVFFDRVISAKRGWRVAGTGLLCALVLLLFSQSYRITQETFTVEPIRQWLEKERIPRGQVLTFWWQINRFNDKDVSSLIPGQIYPYSSHVQKFLINWEAVYGAYRKGLCRYLITSGIGLRSTVGAEPILESAKPLAVWPHPYRTFRHRPYREMPAVPIRIYDLKDVFSDSNLKAVLDRAHARFNP